MQLNPTYLSAQQAFINNALATSTATYNIVIVGSPPPRQLCSTLSRVCVRCGLRPWRCYARTGPSTRCHIQAVDLATPQSNAQVGGRTPSQKLFDPRTVQRSQ